MKREIAQPQSIAIRTHIGRLVFSQKNGPDGAVYFVEGVQPFPDLTDATQLAAPQPIEHDYTLSIPIPEVILRPGWKAPGERGYIGNPAHVLKLKTEGKNFIEIAAELGIPYPTAKMWYYEVTEETPKPSPRYVYDPKELIRLRAAGKTFKEIGEELNVGTRTVYRRYRVALDAGEVPPPTEPPQGKERKN